MHTALSLRCFVWVWVVGLGVAGTVCHRWGRVDFTLTFDSSPIKGEGCMVVFRFVKSCVHCSLSSGVCPINLMFDRRICGRAGFSYLYSFHCFHLAPLVSRHAGIVGAGSSEGHQNPPAT